MILKVCSAFFTLTQSSIATFSTPHWDMPHSTTVVLSAKVGSVTFQHRITTSSAKASESSFYQTVDSDFHFAPFSE